MLVLGLLTGFGAGFVVGQRLTPPEAPRAVDVPRPAIQPGTVPAAPVAPAVVEPPVVDTPVPVAEPEVKEVPERRAPAPAPRTPAPAPRTPAPAPRTPAPASATIRFDSRPPGATVYLDDVRVGVTPMTMDTVAPGTHQVRLEMLGSETWRTSVTVEAGAQHFVGASLE